MTPSNDPINSQVLYYFARVDYGGKSLPQPILRFLFYLLFLREGISNNHGGTSSLVATFYWVGNAIIYQVVGVLLQCSIGRISGG